MIEVKLKVNRTASKKVQNKLKQLQDRLGPGNTKKANRDVALWLWRWVGKNFDTEGGKVGGWADFKYGGRIVSKGATGRGGQRLGTAQSIVNRRYIDPAALLLQDTGLLRTSFDHYSYDHTHATIGSDLPYSAYHEKGVPLRGLPARRMLPKNTDRDVELAIIGIYDFHIFRVTRND